MTVHKYLAELEAEVQGELEAQVRVLGLLTGQEEALKRGSASQIVAKTAEIEVELKRTAARARRRRDVLRKLGRQWGVSADALTLTSIVERARETGVNPTRLASLRGELRVTMAQVVKRARRMGTLARTNAKLMHEAIDTVLRESNAGASTDGGALVNAEA